MKQLSLGFNSIDIEQVISHIHSTDDFLLPAIQRDVVWEDKDIVKLYDSIFRNYPFGNILILKLNGEKDKNITTFYKLNKSNTNQRVLFAGESHELIGDETKYCIIDGQQRLSALYRGRFLNYTNKKNKIMQLYFNALDGYIKNSSLDAFKYGEENSYLFEDKCFWLPLKECFSLSLTCTNNDIDLKITNALNKIQSTLTVPDKNGTQKMSKKNYLRFEDFKTLVNTNKKIIYKNLKTLLKKFKTEKLLNYNLISFNDYTDEQKQERILEIFTRLNKGGKRLAPADLLYSQIATYSTEKLDVRDRFGKYIKKLNESSTDKINFKLQTFIRFLWLLFGESMSFNSFYVSKAIKDHCTAEKFDKAFQALTKAKEIYVDTYFKFTDNTAYNMFLPIAYYFYHSNYDKFNSVEQEEIRYEISKYFQVATISRFVSSEHSDSALTYIKKAFNKFETSNPIDIFTDGKFNFKLLQDEVNNQLPDRTKRFEVDDKDVENILNYDYNKNRQEITQLLYLLNKDLVKSRTKIECDDVDHMHPKKLADENKYKTALSNANSFNQDDFEFFKQNYNSLPNLQLLSDKENRTEKNDEVLNKWLLKYKKNYLDYMAYNFAIEDNTNIDINYFKIENFKNFYNNRKSIIEKKIKELFDMN